VTAYCVVSGLSWTLIQVQDVSAPLIRMFNIRHDHVERTSKHHPGNVLPFQFILNYISSCSLIFQRGGLRKVAHQNYTRQPIHYYLHPTYRASLFVITVHYVTTWTKSAPEQLTVTQIVTNGLLTLTEEDKGICGAQSGAGLRFLRVLPFSAVSTISPCSTR